MVSKRMNQGQAEGSFADAKEDMNFRSICTEENQIRLQKALFWQWDGTSTRCIVRFNRDALEAIFL